MSKQTTLLQTWGYDDGVDEAMDPFDDGNDAMLLNLAKEESEEALEGFDADAGRNYIYPMNYPLRRYQFDIVKTALFSNTLVSLPTGLGKTFIAAVVMYNFFRWYPKAKIVFMAPTKPLVAQQIEACFNIMGLPQAEMVEMTGSTKISDRKELWQQRRIFFLTPQVMSNDLSRDLFPASAVKLLVVDEAHRAQGDYAYCAVVRELCRHSQQFRVLALSATPGSDLVAVRAMLQNLRISKIELRNEDSPDIAQYTFERNVDKIVVPMGQELESMRRLFLQILEHFVKKLAQKGALARRSNSVNPATYSKFTLLQCRNDFRQSPPGRLQRSEIGVVEADFAATISLYHGFELLSQHGMRSTFNFMMKTLEGPSPNKRLLFILNQLPAWRELYNAMSTKFKEDTDNSRLNTSRPHLLSQFSQGPSEETSTLTHGNQLILGHPKLERLRDIIVDHFKTKEEEGVPTRVMIFSQYRDSVIEIAACLHGYRPRIRVMEFVGQAGVKGGKKGLTQKEQIEVVRRFRDNGYNTLVATCVGEEGLDIGEVDLIVCYDVSKSPIRLVQRMGRTGRKRAGRIVVLVTEGKEEFTYDQSMSSKKSINKAILERNKLDDALCVSPRMVPKSLQPLCIKTEMQIEAKFNKNFNKGKSEKGAKDSKRKRDSSLANDSFDEEKQRIFEMRYKVDGGTSSEVSSLLERGLLNRHLECVRNTTSDSKADMTLSLKIAEVFYKRGVAIDNHFESTRTKLLRSLSATFQLSNSEVEHYETEMAKKLNLYPNTITKKTPTIVEEKLPHRGHAIGDKTSTIINPFRPASELSEVHFCQAHTVRAWNNDREDNDNEANVSIEVISNVDDIPVDKERSLPFPFNSVNDTTDRLQIKKPPSLLHEPLPNEAEILSIDLAIMLARFGFKVNSNEDESDTKENGTRCVTDAISKEDANCINSPKATKRRLEVHFASPFSPSHDKCSTRASRLTSTPASKNVPSISMDGNDNSDDETDVFASDDDLWIEEALINDRLAENGCQRVKHESDVVSKEETLLNATELVQQLQITTTSGQSLTSVSTEAMVEDDKIGDDEENDSFFKNIDSNLFVSEEQASKIEMRQDEVTASAKKRKQQDETFSPLPQKRTKALAIDSSADESVRFEPREQRSMKVGVMPKVVKEDVVAFFDQEAVLDDDGDDRSKVPSSDESHGDDEAYEESFVDDANHCNDVSLSQRAHYIQSLKRSPKSRPLQSSRASLRRKADVCSQPLLNETEEESYEESFVTSEVEYKSELMDTLDLAEAGKLDLSDGGKKPLRILRRMNESSEDEHKEDEETKPKPVIEPMDGAKANRLKKQKELQEAFKKKMAQKLQQQQEQHEFERKETLRKDKTLSQQQINKPEISNPSFNPTISPSSSASKNLPKAFFSPIVMSTSSVSRSHELVSQMRHTHKLQVVHRKLNSASLILSYRVGLERMSLSSFVNCSQRSALITLIQSMNDAFERPCLIVELDSEQSLLALQTTTKRTRYVDCLFAQIGQSNLQLFFSNSQAETADIVKEIYLAESKKGHGLPPQAMQLSQQDEQLLGFYEQLPGIGFCSALRLLLGFSSLRSFLTSSKEEMKEKAGMTETVAKAVFQFVNNDCRS